ncbi:MAG: hypothetical protein DM484_25965 [Candidatus Methylumidiphilus alinenensis]|uniref:Uncharacterized protein n=1 Tax=Candidatus Methylumidiphilus alinenensis TaxID=2202197 RepID=A0A2W4SJ67_9GAMM|nr:MAG: hypothetical protein DM484_25965 [Candidatus Methylumidiphilus alinenensis]
MLTYGGDKPALSWEPRSKSFQALGTSLNDFGDLVHASSNSHFEENRAGLEPATTNRHSASCS